MRSLQKKFRDWSWVSELKEKPQTFIHPTDLLTRTWHYFGFWLCRLFMLVSLSRNPFVLTRTYISQLLRAEHVILILKTWLFHAISSDLPALKNFEIKMSWGLDPRWLGIVMRGCSQLNLYSWIRRQNSWRRALFNATSFSRGLLKDVYLWHCALQQEI